MSKHFNDLNDDCILTVLKYLPIDSHINFTKVCRRFEYIWENYKRSIYNKLELGATTPKGFEQELLLLPKISGYVRHLILNFNRHFPWSKECLAQVMNELIIMTDLEHVILWIRDKESFETFNSFLRILQQLPNLKSIVAYQGKTVVESLYHFNDYEDLVIESKMSRNPLMETIDTHSKIRLWSIDKSSIFLTLKELVEHATCVKELSFRMTQRAEEYVPLAELAQLQKLQVFGNRLLVDYGPLLPLLSAISSNPSKQLHSLTLHLPGLGYKEILEITRISTLQRLDCHFTDPQCLKLLTRLPELRELFIQIPNSSNIDNLVLSVLKSCRKLTVLQIDSPNLSHNFVSKAYEELLGVRNPDDQKPLKLLFGKTALSLDQHTQRYLTVYWNASR